MNENEFARQIRNAWTVAYEILEVGRAVTTFASLGVDDEFREVALSGSSTYEEIFRTGLRRSNYNIILQDYGYFQFGFFSDESWRLAYYPNPFVSGDVLA